MKQIAAEIKLRTWLFKKYPINYLSQMIIFTVSFAVFFIAQSNTNKSDMFRGAIIGYCVWILFSQTIFYMGRNISDQAKTGELEYYFLLPISDSKYFFIKSCVNTMFAILEMIIVLIALIFAFNVNFSFSIINLLPILMILVTNIGLGYLFLGLAIRFKKIDSLFQIVQYLFLFLYLVQFYSKNIYLEILQVGIPLEPMIAWLRLEQNNYIYSIPLYFFLSLCNMIIFSTIGYISFKYYRDITKKYGKLGTY